ncbi:MAG: LysE family transporter [Alphaproteobacteria bacterium]|nr:LysE family transporter [Alphaproteobacteria bacterium]MBT5390043.1 LysE family transporter [Alphaproteobacteria bacterium]MBT5540303.1 LysE family transporter [Alphaproteobacteria bacterium]MBT5654865.1 LysE family transporter [Alphaproteobacteria bacterium]
MLEYWPEFLALYTINLINLMSPGAGCALVARNSMAYSRKSGLFTAFGIVSSSFIHKAYALLGFGLIISQTPVLLMTIKYIGCAYLLYLGVMCFINSMKKNGQSAFSVGDIQNSGKDIPRKQSFRMGFFTDLLNPMASVAFLSIVSATVNPATPLKVQAFYGLCLISTSLIWYSLLAYFFSNECFQVFFEKSSRWVEGFSGSVFIWFGIKMAT